MFLLLLLFLFKNKKILIELFVYKIYYVDCVANKNYNNSERIQILYFLLSQKNSLSKKRTVDYCVANLKIQV